MFDSKLLCCFDEIPFHSGPNHYHASGLSPETSAAAAAEMILGPNSFAYLEHAVRQ